MSDYCPFNSKCREGRISPTVGLRKFRQEIKTTVSSWSYVIIFSIIFIIMGSPVLGDTCRTFNTSNKELYLNYFTGDKKADNLKENVSLIFGDSTPTNVSEIKTFVVPDGKSPKINFSYKIEPNSLYYKLSFYINGKPQKMYERNKKDKWLKSNIYDDFAKDDKPQELKWTLEYNQLPYLDVEPSSRAFIGDLKLCDLRFENEAKPAVLNENPSESSSSGINKSKNLLSAKLGDDLNKIMGQILKEQKQDNFTIEILELEPGIHKTSSSLEVRELKNLTIMGNNDLSAGINGPSNNPAINISNSSNITIQNLFFNNSEEGIHLQDCRRCLIYNNIFNNLLAGIIINNGIRNNISSNNILSSSPRSKGIILFNNSSLNNLILNNVDSSDTEYYLFERARDNIIIIGGDDKNCEIIDEQTQYKVCGTGFNKSDESNCRNNIRTVLNNTFIIGRSS
jgi:parallel beta-helix repeat protein